MKQSELYEREKISKTLNMSRSIAIVSVITAHTAHEVNNPVLLALINRFSSVGVICFIIISGYYFNPGKYKTIPAFFKNKITTIVVPWVFIGSGVFLLSGLKMKRSVGIISLMQFLIGYNSYLYYLTVLMLCYLIYFIPVKNNNKPVIYISFGVSILSLQLTAWGIVDIHTIHLTNYLNILNWIGYFCIGLLLKSLNVYKITEYCRKHMLLLAFCWAAVFLASLRFDRAAGYFSIFAIPLQLIAAFMVFGISSYSFMDCFAVNTVSRLSFCIYLLHMAVVPIVYKFFGAIYLIKLFMPLITAGSIVLCLVLAELLAQKLKLTKLFYTLSGIRPARKEK